MIDQKKQETPSDLEDIGIDVEGSELSNSDVLEFNFVDSSNILCGICSRVVPYETLFSEHMVNHHREFAEYILEDVPCDPYIQPLYEQKPKKRPDPLEINDPPRQIRRVSQIRVNTQTMSLEELESSLRKKMVEKMGRKIPVSLVDKEHARCGICNAVLSLNRKFEVVHLVRHFNAWHPSEHKCTGEWLRRSTSNLPDTFNGTRLLSAMDFAVIDLIAGANDNLQCIWCGMFMDVNSIATHFHEIHPEEVEIPTCRLCLHELVANSRFTEKFGENMEITLPDEHHFKSGRFGLMTSSESAMDRAVTRELKKITPNNDESDEEGEDDEQGVGPEPFANSRMTLGKRSRPKRTFILPALRQATPMNSEFLDPVSNCHWICKLCNTSILAAVISAGAIKHFRQFHPTRLEQMQFELCKARLEKVSDGCMEFLDPESIECLICNMNYPLHKPYNMCRAIRHLKLKHPEQMPEHNITSIENMPQDAIMESMDEEDEVEVDISS